jgi:hypothetical protein
MDQLSTEKKVKKKMKGRWIFIFMTMKTFSCGVAFDGQRRQRANLPH